MPHHFLRLSAFLLLMVVARPISAQEPTARRYPVKLDFPERAGERYHLEGSSSNRRTYTLTVPGQFAQTTEDTFAIELSADSVIEAVENDFATRKRFTILRSQITKGGSSRPLLPEGTIVVVSRVNDKTVFQMGDTPIEEEMSGWLATLIALHTAAVGDDGLFGTTTPKAVGESWPVSVEEVKKLLKEMGSQGSGQKISGGGNLEKIDGNHMIVRSSVIVRDLLLPMTEGFTPASGQVTVDYLGRLPLSQSDSTRSVTGSFRMNLTGNKPSERGPIKLEYLVDSSSKYEIRPSAPEKAKN